MATTRRRFIQRGLLGGALLGVAGAGLAAWPTTRTWVPATKLLFLSERAFAILAAVASRVVPTAQDPGSIAQRIDASLIDVPPETRADIEQLLLLFDNALAGAALDLRFAPFTALDAAQQDRVLERWRDSRITLRRGGYQALRRLCLAIHYSELSTQRVSGFEGPRRVPGLDYDDSKIGTPEWLAAQAQAQGSPK